MLVLKTNLFINAGLRFQIAIPHQIAGGTTGVTALTVAVENIVRVQLVEVRRLVSTGNAQLQRPVVCQLLGQVQ